MGNPLIPQGVLNRVRASVIWTTFPELNVTAPYLGRAGITLAPDGAATVFLPTMTGAVPSMEPYQKMTLTVNLLRTQQLADLYKRQMETSSLLGDGVVRPDIQQGGIGLYQLSNCAIENFRELAFAGADAGYMVLLGGYYNINSTLFD
jgi:hypothetical protein